jgi:hypothetical protein
MLDMSPMHGLDSFPLGLRTRSLGKGGSLGEVVARARAAGEDLLATILIKKIGK